MIILQNKGKILLLTNDEVRVLGDFVKNHPIFSAG